MQLNRWNHFPPLNSQKQSSIRKSQFGDFFLEFSDVGVHSTHLQSELPSGLEGKNAQGIETEVPTPAIKNSGEVRLSLNFSGSPPSGVTRGSLGIQKSYLDARSGGSISHLERFGTIDISGDIPVDVFRLSVLLRGYAPKRALLIGMTHEFDHHKDNEFLKDWSKREGIAVQLAYDGLRISVDL